MTTTLLEKPRNYNLDSYTKKVIETKHSEGIPQTTIAKEIGFTQTTVSKHLAKPETKAITDRLKETLQKKYATRFIARKIKEEKTAYDLADIAMGNTDQSSNKTMYDNIDRIEKYLDRQDKSALKIMQGVSILASNAIPLHIGDNNTQVVITPSYQAFLDYQSTQPIDEPVKEADTG
jgi:predicted transcriptional regulator